MDYRPCYLVVVKPNDIKKIVPDLFQKIEDSLQKSGITLVQALIDANEHYMDYDEDLETDEAIIFLIEDLMEAFKEKTGLELYIGRPNSEEDWASYDDADGAYFCLALWDAYMLNPQLMALGIKADIRSYVSYDEDKEDTIGKRRSRIISEG